MRADALEYIRHHRFGVIPRRVRAHPLFGARRELHRQIAVETEIGIGRKDQFVDLEALVGELLLGAEDVRVVLREAAHAHQAVHGARRLVAMDHAELGEPQRQVAVAFEPVLEESARGPDSSSA